LQRVRTRRQLRGTTVSVASIPLLALGKKAAPAQNQGGNNRSCFLKGTKISTPSGDRLVQNLRIGDEVQTLADRKKLSGLTTTNSQRQKVELGRMA
jgi:hypothetical protein